MKKAESERAAPPRPPKVPRLYAVPLLQGAWVPKVCWGSCGLGLIGAISLGNYGEAIPCITPAAECPAFDRELDEPSGTIDDGERPERPIYLRKLKEPVGGNAADRPPPGPSDPATSRGGG